MSLDIEGKIKNKELGKKIYAWHRCENTREKPYYYLLKTAMRQLRLTACVYHRVLKLGRTIADLAGSEAITRVC